MLNHVDFTMKTRDLMMIVMHSWMCLEKWYLDHVCGQFDGENDDKLINHQNIPKSMKFGSSVVVDDERRFQQDYTIDIVYCYSN